MTVLPNIIEKHRSAIIQLCQRYGVIRLAVFGSAVTNHFDPATSDLDFVAQFANTQAADYADRYFDLAEALEALFERPVDLVTEHSIHNPYFRAEVNRTQYLIYELAHQTTSV